MKPETEPTVALSLTVKDTAAALGFYSKAFNAKELFRLPTPDGGIAHALFMVGNTSINISDESPDWHAYAMPEKSVASCLLRLLQIIVTRLMIRL